jgi:hypothetical protein
MQRATGVNRRQFLEDAAIAALWASPISAAAGGAEEWFDRPMRWAQLTLAEDDPGKYDPQFWLDYFRRTHSDAACLSAGGCVAYYPTKIPLHYRSKWLGDADPFGELAAGCRKLNMVVIARTDSHAVRQDVCDAHPDWIAVDEHGRKRRHWASPEYWVTCGLGPYNFEFMTAVHREILTLYQVDGIFTNRWMGSGMCYCRHCREGFRAAYGMELPRSADPADPGRRKYAQWRRDRLFKLWRVWDEEIRNINPAARYIPNEIGGLDWKTIGEMAPTLFSWQARQGLKAPWAFGKRGKEYRAIMGRKAIAGVFGIIVDQPYRWKDSFNTEAEIRITVADGIANDLRPWFTKFCGTLHDHRWLKVIEDIYRWHYRSERYLRNEEPLARVAMIHSQPSALFRGETEPRYRAEDHELGMYHALVEARIPFEIEHDGHLDAAHLDRFKVLVLPNVAALSEAQCEQLRGYVARGGSLVATFETSRFDQEGQPRRDFGLADLFGVSFKGRYAGSMQNSYLNLEPDPATGKRHPLLKGLDDAQRIINGTQRLEVTPTLRHVHPALTLIPSYPDLPMEMLYPRVSKTDIPEVYVREADGSRIVYFPWDIDRVFWEVLCADHGKLLGNAVDWAAGEERPVTVTGPGILDVTVWRQKGSITVHLVNLTNPMMMKGPFREVIPIGEQQVTVRLPRGKRAARVQLLAAGGTPPVREEAGALHLAVPSILVHEVVAIDLV